MKEPETNTNLRVLLLTTARSYRSDSFLEAADKLGIEVVQAVHMPAELACRWENGFGVDFGRQPESLAEIAAFHQEKPFDAVLPVDDSGGILAAAAASWLGLPHNSAVAAEATRDKLNFRRMLSAVELNSPAFVEYRTGDDLAEAAAKTGFPCVVKPRSLNGSRGVIRANNLTELDAAIRRTSRLVRKVLGTGKNEEISLLIESYIPGDEVALEAVVDNGRLIVVALFDKPDPLVGPYFEETIYVTPSRLSAKCQDDIISCVAAAAAALGLRTGPVHAELRLNDLGPWILEIAGRSIGGLCSRVLRFGTAGSLEELILRQSCGMDFEFLIETTGARGVMMIPIPEGGLLRQVYGLAEAKHIPGIDDVVISAPLDNPIKPLPEGDGYLGFIFARGISPEDVEEALREAHRSLSFRIDPLLPLL